MFYALYFIEHFQTDCILKFEERLISALPVFGHPQLAGLSVDASLTLTLTTTATLTTTTTLLFNTVPALLMNKNSVVDPMAFHLVWTRSLVLRVI